MAGDANVRVVVSAITEAAESALDSVGDELTDVGEDATVAQVGMDQVSDEMGETTRSSAILQAALDEMSDEMVEGSLAAQLLQNSLDEVGDEAMKAAGASAAASGAFSSLSISSDGASVSVGSLSTVFLLSLIPAILTLSTVLAPLVVMMGALAAGAAALAGAFGLVVGSGILAFGEKKAEQNQEELAQTKRLIKQYETMQATQGALTAQQQDRLRQLRKKKKELEDQTTAMGALAGVVSDLKEELKPLIVDFGQEFIPLISQAVDAIPEVVEEMFGAVGGTDAFKDGLRSFGRVAADVLPTLVGLMFDLARYAMPILQDFISFLQDNGDQALQDMQQSVEELAPEMYDLLDAIIDFSPTLLKFGTHVGNIVLPALTDLIKASDDFMESINELDPQMRDLVISGMILAPVILKLVGLVTSLVGLFTGASGGLGLIGASKLLAGALGGTGAGVYGAAILAGAGLGLMGVKALDAMGAFKKLRSEGKKLRKEMGGDNMDAALGKANLATAGGLEAVSKAGVTAVDIARGERDMGRQERKQLSENFDRGEQKAGKRIVHQNTDVSVDVGGDLKQDPYSFSRDLADQVNREKRSNGGT